MTAAPLLIHVGYPKTATTTFQVHVFPHHPEIDYLGKFLPSHRYREEETYHQIDDLLHRSELRAPDLGPLREYIQSARLQSSRKVVLISSESFIHPAASDLARVAARLKDAVGDGKILITIREQIGSILSFYWMHGRHGEYLSIGAREISERLVFPLSFSEWIKVQMNAPDRNYLATLKYDEVIDCYAKIFGKRNISVLMFETLMNAPDLYAYQIGNALGVDVEIIKKLMTGGRENPSEDRAAPWTRQDAAALDEDVIVSLRDYYRVGNKRLIVNHKLPVGTLGYAV
jgi:hypothetical protein